MTILEKTLALVFLCCVELIALVLATLCFIDANWTRKNTERKEKRDGKVTIAIEIVLGIVCLCIAIAIFFVSTFFFLFLK